MSASPVLPFAASLWDPDTVNPLRTQVERRQHVEASSHRERALRVRMQGSGYRAVVDDRSVSLINLSLSGVLVRGPMRLLPSQSIIFKIGWPQDGQLCAAIGRVRWVEFEPAEKQDEAPCRVGLAFETWDVRRMKEIIHHCRRMVVPSFKTA
jgi:PilZ domain